MEKGNPHKIVEKAINKYIKIFISQEILEELSKVLKRDFEEPEDLIERQIQLIKEYCDVVDITEKIDVIKVDPDDNRIIECAFSANAGFIVSGDMHLLNLKEHKGIKVLSPKVFLDLINKNID